MSDGIMMRGDFGASDLAKDFANSRIESPAGNGLTHGDFDEDHDEETDARVQAQTGVRDTAGTLFNPSLHAMDKDGNPSLTRTGKFRAKRGAGGYQAGPGINIPNAAPAPSACRPAAIAATNVFIVTGMSLFGDEWKPNRDLNEPEAVVTAFENYFEAKGITDFPPGAALVMALGAYALVRLQQPKTLSKLERLALWSRAQFRRGKQFVSGSNGDAARHDYRPNGMRENDASARADQGSSRSWYSRFSSRP
jgi:hypothetical protein